MKRMVLLSLGLMASSSLFSASLTEMFTHTTPQQGIPLTDTFTLPSFDESLGSLTAVTISLANTTIGNVVVYNLSGASQNFTNATASIPESLTSIAGTLTSTISAGPLSGTAAPGVNFYSGLAGKSTATLNAANLGAFTTRGAVPLSFSLLSGVASFAGNTTAPGGTVFFGGDATVGSLTTVSYTYNTPADVAAEPGTWGLVASSCLAVLFVARKRVLKKEAGTGNCRPPVCLSLTDVTPISVH
jgi:hypothetical protein